MERHRRDFAGKPGGQEDDADDEPDWRGDDGGELRGQNDEGGGAGEAVVNREAGEGLARGRRTQRELVEARLSGERVVEAEGGNRSDNCKDTGTESGGNEQWNERR